MPSNEARSAGLAPKPARRSRCSIPVRPRAMRLSPEKRANDTAIPGEGMGELSSPYLQFPSRTDVWRGTRSESCKVSAFPLPCVNYKFMSTRRKASKRAKRSSRSPTSRPVRRRTAPSVSARPAPPSDAASGLAPGMHPINTYLAVANVGASMDFLERAFGLSRGVVLPDADGQIRYAEMRHGDSVVMLIRKGDAGDGDRGITRRSMPTSATSTSSRRRPVRRAAGSVTRRTCRGAIAPRS